MQGAWPNNKAKRRIRKKRSEHRVIEMFILPSLSSPSSRPLAKVLCNHEHNVPLVFDGCLLAYLCCNMAHETQGKREREKEREKAITGMYTVLSS